MKIRTDFVTNSSSSSFVLAFKDMDDAEAKMKEACDVYNDRYYNQIMEEIRTSKNLGIDEAVEEYMEDSGWSIIYSVARFARETMHMGYVESVEFARNGAGKELVEKETASVKEQFRKQLEGMNVIVFVEHGDGGYGEDGVFEHDILPNCCVSRISHH